MLTLSRALLGPVTMLLLCSALQKLNESFHPSRNGRRNQGKHHPFSQRKEKKLTTQQISEHRIPQQPSKIHRPIPLPHNIRLSDASSLRYRMETHLHLLSRQRITRPRAGLSRRRTYPTRDQPVLVRRRASRPSLDSQGGRAWNFGVDFYGEL